MSSGAAPQRAAARGDRDRVAASIGRASRADLDGHGWALRRRLLTRRASAGDCRPLRRRPLVPEPRRHGAARLRPRRVQVLQLSAAERRRRAAHGALSAPRSASRTAGTRRWASRCAIPDAHAELHLERCHEAGQTRPTPLLLRYGPGDYNCLHQDLYGEHVFPLQVAFLLSEPGSDFTGGEFVLTEQRPRMQSRAEVVPLRRGDGVVFAVRHRPVQGTAGYLPRQPAARREPAPLGTRHTLGVIFHDAK